MNTRKIVFSILVHERWDVVLDQIYNYLTLNPDCAVVLHKSIGFNNTKSTLTEISFMDAIKNEDNVYINPISVRTGLYDLIQAHLSNFEYIFDKIEFEYFVPSASNELFILPNVYESMAGYDCGYGFEDLKDYSKWEQYAYAKTDQVLSNIIKDNNGKGIVGAQIEGSFYSKRLFKKISSIIDKYYDYNKMSVKYAREEFYFSTIVDALISSGERYKVLENKPFTRIDWTRNLTLSIRLYEVRRWIKSKQYFCVKRVDRVFNSAIREYIRKEYGYEQLLSRYIDFEKKSYFGIYVDSCKDFILTYWSLIPRAIKKIKKLAH